MSTSVSAKVDYGGVQLRTGRALDSLYDVRAGLEDEAEPLGVEARHRRG